MKRAATSRPHSSPAFVWPCLGTGITFRDVSAGEVESLPLVREWAAPFLKVRTTSLRLWPRPFQAAAQEELLGG